jgi:hypothetical protein
LKQSLRNIIGFSVHGTDCDQGKVNEFFDDDTTWTICYTVSNAGNRLSGRKVLIPLAATGKPDWKSRIFSVNHSCVQVLSSPDIDRENSLYHQNETDVHSYYQWPRNFSSNYDAIAEIKEHSLSAPAFMEKSSVSASLNYEHSHSPRQIFGYTLFATNGGIGHIANISVDVDNWVHNYLVADIGACLCAGQAEMHTLPEKTTAALVGK